MKNKALKFINPILFILLLTVFVSMLLYKLGPDHLKYSESMSELHTFAGVLFFIVGIIHIYLNWSWIKSNLIGKSKKK